MRDHIKETFKNLGPFILSFYINCRETKFLLSLQYARFLFDPGVRLSKDKYGINVRAQVSLALILDN